MPDGLFKSRAPERALTRLSDPSVGMSAAAESAGDRADVHALGAQRGLRAAFDLSEVPHDLDAGHAPEAVYGLLGVELGSPGALVVVIVHRRDQSLPVALGFGHGDPYDVQLLDRAGAVYPAADLRRYYPGTQKVGDQLVGLGGDVPEPEAAGIGRDAGVDRLGRFLGQGHADLGVEGGHDLGARGGFLVDEVELPVERVVLVVVEVQAHRVHALVCHAGPVGPRGVDHHEIVARRALPEGLVGQEPAEVVRYLLGVAETGLGAQFLSEAHECGRGSYGVPVGPDVGGNGGFVQTLQEIRDLARGVTHPARF